jgi:hypothetical protein
MTAVMQAAPAYAENEALRTEYRAAFREYSIRLDALQQLMAAGAPDESRIEAALLEVEKARIACNCARDRLVRLALPSLPPGDAAGAGPFHEGRVRKTAQLLWEMAGRPDGTAERDWLRAEQLVRSATARAC